MKEILKMTDGTDIPRKRKRLGWPTKLVIAVVAVCLLLVGAWWYGNSRWNRKIQVLLDQYRAAGQPVDPEDFDPPATIDDDNAALALKEAAAAVTLTTDQDDLVGYVDPVLIADNLDEFRRIAEANAPVFELVRRARSMKGADWGVRMRSPAINVLLPSLSEQQALGRLLCSTAIYHHKTGGETEAIETLRDALAIGKTMRKMPTLVPDLVALAIESLVYIAVEDIAADLNASGPSGAGVRVKTKSLIGELLDEKRIREDGKWVYYGERAWLFDTAKLWMRGKLSLTSFNGEPSAKEKTLIVLFKPLHKRDLFEMLQEFTATAEAAGQPSWPEARGMIPPEPQYGSVWDDVSKTIRRLIMPSMKRVLLLRFRPIAMRRMAATALAIRLYETDHGRRPAKLAELVPQYLPAVPKDPFAADDRAIGYLPNAPRPLLYSIGYNEIDQGGKYADDPENPPNLEDFDIPFFLNADRPRCRDEEEYQKDAPPAGESAPMQPNLPSQTKPHEVKPGA